MSTLSQQAEIIAGITRSLQQAATAMKSASIAQLTSQAAIEKAAGRDSSQLDAALRSLSGAAGDVRQANRNLVTTTNDIQQGSSDIRGAVAGSMTQADGVLKNVNATLENLISDDLYDRMSGIQNRLGGIGQGFGAADTAGGRVARMFTEMDQALQGGDSSVSSLGINLNDLLGEINEASKALDVMITGTQGTVDGLTVMKTATADTGLEMAVFGTTMGLSAEETSTFITRAITLQNEASTDMLRDAAVYSKRIAGVTGDSAKVIMGEIEQIVRNTNNYGNVTIETAAMIAGTLRQLGIDYEDFNGMIGKYLSFDSAAQSVSALTSVFGVQIDAMEMMELANEDQFGFLLRMREQFLLTAKSVDDMSQAELRLIQSQLGLSDVEAVQRLLDPDREISSMEDLAGATEGAATTTEGAIEELKDELDRFGDISENTIERYADNLHKSVYAQTQTTLIDAARQYDRFYDEVTRMGQEHGADVGQSAIVQGGVEQLTDGLLDAAEELKETFENAFKQLPRFFRAALTAMGVEFEESDFSEESPTSKISSEFASTWLNAIWQVPPATSEMLSEMEGLTAQSLQVLSKDTDSWAGQVKERSDQLGLSWDEMGTGMQQAWMQRYNMSAEQGRILVAASQDSDQREARTTSTRIAEALERYKDQYAGNEEGLRAQLSQLAAGNNLSLDMLTQYYQQAVVGGNARSDIIFESIRSLQRRGVSTSAEDNDTEERRLRSDAERRAAEASRIREANGTTMAQNTLITQIATAINAMKTSVDTLNRNFTEGNITAVVPNISVEVDGNAIATAVADVRADGGGFTTGRGNRLAFEPQNS